MKQSIKDLWKSKRIFRAGIIAVLVIAVAGGSFSIYQNVIKNISSLFVKTSGSDNISNNQASPGVKAGNLDKSSNTDLSSYPLNSMALFLSKNGKNYLNPNLGPSGREIIKPEPGDVGTWNIPVPLINALGSQKLYSGTSYHKRRSFKLKQIINFTEFYKELDGEVWYLSVNNGSGLPVQFLKEYAEKMGAVIFSDVYGDSLIFRLKSDGAIWWCDAYETNGGYEFAILKQILVEAGKEYTVSGDTLGNIVIQKNSIAFCTENTGEKFQTFRISLPSGKIRIRAENHNSHGSSSSNCGYDITLDSKESNTFILDDFPQAEGIYEWHLDPQENDIPSSMTILPEERYDIPRIKNGSELGVLLVKDVPPGSIYVCPQKFVSIDYSEGGQRNLYGEGNEIEGSHTSEGDLQFILPPGLWTIVNRASFMYNGSARAQLIPVNSGEQTVVTLPDSLKSANTRLNSMADDSELTGSIEITEAKDLSTTAEISVSVSDPLDRDIDPSKENTMIYEGSSKVEVTDIRRVVAPCSVALVIDSSGSMKSDMKATLEAARTFIKTLPEGSFVKVIDFDTKVTELKGETPQDAMKALSQITAGGYTKLYDATLKGVEAVKGKTRPAVVVFTDGRDSSLDKSGGGSVNSKSSVAGKIKESKIPVYTIGFGKRLNEEQKAAGKVVDGSPDIQCLLEFASAGGGQYFPAKDPEALTGVFTAISSKLGNQFVITYKRPTEHNISETPFVSIVADNSGSMNTDPSKGVDCNYRMQKTVSLFHDFLEKLPPRTMMQLTTFQTPIMSPPLVIQQQTTTDQKVNMIKALGEMKAHGGTPLVEALRTAYENIIPVPSSKKVIVFLTDGGLQVKPEQLQQYNDLLEKIKKKNISILFIGMGAHSIEQVFADAAKATGGDYVISEDIEEIQAKLNQLLNTLKETGSSDTIPISISLKWDTTGGDVLQYAVADEVKFSQPKKAGPPIEPDMIKIVTGQPYHRYAGSTSDSAIGSVVTGLGIPGTDNIITNQVSFDKKLSNKAMEMTVKSAVYLSRFQGVDARRAGKQFIALEVELENKTEKKIPYEIPSLFKHFYLGVNQGGLYPASKATWLSDKPLAAFGSPKITINPGEKKSGVLVFIVPNSQGISQMSSHFYDTEYGHIQIPLVGKMTDKWLEIEKLPKTAPASLSDTFSMQATGASIKPAIEQYKSGDFSTFRIAEAKFESKVQALLNLDPKERFWLKLDTKSGSLMSKLSNATSALPFGFLEPVMLGPASDNPVRMAFDIPSRMDKYKSDLFVDLATGSREFPVSSGEVYGAPNSVATVDGPGIRITVNQLVSAPEGITIPVNNSSGRKAFTNMVILDVTVTDLPGNEGTRIPGDFFSLVNKNYKAPSEAVTAGRIGIGGGGNPDGNIAEPYKDTERLVFGAGSGFGVFEGQSRRGIVLFQQPKGAIEDWTLQSRYMENLRVPITKEPFSSPELLGYKADVQISKEFEDQLEAAVTAAVERNAALSDEASSMVNVSLRDGDGRQNVPMPSISTYGLGQLARINNEAEVIHTLQVLRCLPLNRSGGYLLTYGYQPEAVLTQGWGEIGDLTNLALRILSRLGYSPEVRPLSLTAAGEKALLDFSGVDAKETVPLGITYRNSAGESKTLVIPFMMDLSELEGFVYYPTDYAGNVSYSQEKASIEVSVQYEPGTAGGTAAEAAGDISGALGGDVGGSSTRKLLMLETSIPLAELSIDAIDLCFMPASGSGTAKSYHALLSTPNGVITGNTALENPARVLGIEVVIKVNGVRENMVHYSTLGEGDSLDKFFQTIAINLPDLTEEAAAVLDERSRQVHDSAKNPDPLSIAKWYGRNALYQFISGSSMLDQQMVGEFGLVLGRISQPRCLVITSCLDKSDTMHTTMDLLQPWNQIHAGKEEARKAYQLLAGFYMSDLEAEVLPGDNKVSYLDLWTQAPSGTTIEAIPVMSDIKDREALFKQMEQQGKYPPLLLKAVKENKNLIFAPTVPTVFMGRERWAWLEIDPETYRAISVFDNGLHAGMSEFKLSLLPTEDDTIKWMKGIWVGTNISVWTMCSSNLKYGDNYKAVKRDAKKTATEAAKAVSKFFGLAGDIEGKAKSIKDMDPKHSVSFDLGPSHKITFTISMSGISVKVSQKMFNLSAGMKLAIDAYFR